MCEHKIEDYTFVLYNIMFYGEELNNSSRCRGMSCKSEEQKCICIDHEQAGLLRKLLSDEDPIIFDFGYEEFVFRNLRNKEENLCDDAGNKLYRNCFFPEYTESVKGLADKYLIQGTCLLEVIKSIPILYTVNSRYNLDGRDSLVYLSVYASCPEIYLSVLLRAIICKAIECCTETEFLQGKENDTQTLIGLLQRLQARLNQDDKQIIDMCIWNGQVYIDQWKKLCSDIHTSLEPLISSGLQEYLAALKSRNNNPVIKEEKGKYNKLCRLLKKILETAGLSTENFPEQLFSGQSDSENVKTDYDKVMDILSQVQGNTSKQQQIWAVLSQVFGSGEDIPTDDLEKMEEIANL